MINVSDEFKELMNQRTDFKEQATVTFTDGTELDLSADDFSVMNNSYTDGAGASALPLGEAVCRSIELELINDNDQLEEYDFYGATIRLYLTFDLSSTTEKIELGTFTVTTPETYGTVVSITAVDDMYKADKSYSTGLTFPATLQSMFLEICDTLGFAYDTAEFNNYSFQVQTQPSSDYTYRQILGYIAQIAGGNARFNRQGYLEILSYDFTAEGHDLTEWASLTVATNDITITGIQTTVITTTTSTDEDGNEITEDNTETVLYGAEGYVLSVSNPLISGDEENALALIGSGLVGQGLRIFSGTYIAYPLAEFMDACTVTDRKGTAYNSIITDVDFTFFGPTLLSNSAEVGLKNASTYGGSGTETLIQAKKLIDKETSAREAAVKALQESLSTSSGLYATAEKQDDGSTIYYLHDKPTLAESANVIKLTAETIGFSTDGGETYPYGFTINGDVIAKLLYAEGINADYIITGALTVEDSDGNIIFQADVKNKSVTVGGFAIGDKAIYNGPASLYDTTSGIYLGTDGIMSLLSSSTLVRIVNGHITGYMYDDMNEQQYMWVIGGDANGVSFYKLTDEETQAYEISAMYGPEAAEIWGTLNVHDTIYNGQASIRVPEIQRGNLTITPSAANTPTWVTVSFPSDFDGTPIVTASAASTTPGTQVTGVSAYNTNYAETTIYVTRTNTTATGVNWVAVY